MEWSDLPVLPFFFCLLTGGQQSPPSLIEILHIP